MAICASDKVRVGIIGCGGIANGKHMPSLKRLKNIEMVAFCDIIEERAIKAKEKYGISPKCAFYVDLSGASWSVVNCFAKMGIKYIGILANSFRNSKPNTDIPPLFWWQGKIGW